MPHISIRPEVIVKIFGFPVTNSFFSATIVVLCFILIAVYYKKQLSLSLEKRSLFFYLLHYLNNSLYRLFYGIFEKNIERFFPLLSGLFIYILLQNWFELIPGVGSILISMGDHGKGEFIPILRGNTADLNTTFALALISVVLIQYYGIKFLGFRGYLKKFVNLSNPLTFFTGILEIISEVSKVISFAFRLFGNMFAGEVLLVIIGFLVPILASFPFLVLEIFVGLVQALVFSMLTAVFINVATSGED